MIELLGAGPGFGGGALGLTHSLGDPAVSLGIGVGQQGLGLLGGQFDQPDNRRAGLGTRGDPNLADIAVGAVQHLPRRRGRRLLGGLRALLGRRQFLLAVVQLATQFLELTVQVLVLGAQLLAAGLRQVAAGPQLVQLSAQLSDLTAQPLVLLVKLAARRLQRSVLVAQGIQLASQAAGRGLRVLQLVAQGIISFTGGSLATRATGT